MWQFVSMAWEMLSWVLWAEKRTTCFLQSTYRFWPQLICLLQALLVLQDTFLQKCYEKILMENLWICGHVVRSYCESLIQSTLRCLKGEKLTQGALWCASENRYLIKFSINFCGGHWIFCYSLQASVFKNYLLSFIIMAFLAISTQHPFKEY